MIISVPSHTKPNTILHETGYSEYFGTGVGGLSIKSFFGGQAFYEVGRNRYRVGNGTHLILNQGQSYTIRISADKPVESFCIFFAKGFAEQVYQGLTMPHILDNSFQSEPSFHFFEKTYYPDDLLTPTILQIHAGIKNQQMLVGWLEEKMQRLMAHLLQVHFNVYREVELLPALRPATRQALYRNLHYARDYAIALFNTPVTLAELADVACMSPNHLVRTFKQVFGQTPHQFIISKRLEEAQRLLLQSGESITEICLDVGFESLGTFSSLFHRRFGVSPTAFRQQNGDFQEAFPHKTIYN